jgi:hypothetical protein
VDLKDRLAGIDANLDDLQAGVEACARAAEALYTDTAKFAELLKRIKNAPVIASLLKRAGDLEAFARDQRGTMEELRVQIARLQEDLRHSNFAATRPRLAAASDRSRR